VPQFLYISVRLVKNISATGRGARRLEAKALSVAMAQVPPNAAPIPKGGSLDLIMTRTTPVGNLGGSLNPRQRNVLLACIAEVSLIVGKLRWGAGLVLKSYLVKKLEQPAALTPNLEDTRPVRTSSRRKSALLPESSGIPTVRHVIHGQELTSLTLRRKCFIFIIIIIFRIFNLVLD
jgi:hypothetical protein